MRHPFAISVITFLLLGNTIALCQYTVKPTYLEYEWTSYDSIMSEVPFVKLTQKGDIFSYYSGIDTQCVSIYEINGERKVRFPITVSRNCRLQDIKESKTGNVYISGVGSMYLTGDPIDRPFHGYLDVKRDSIDIHSLLYVLPQQPVSIQRDDTSLVGLWQRSIFGIGTILFCGIMDKDSADCKRFALDTVDSQLIVHKVFSLDEKNYIGCIRERNLSKGWFDTFLIRFTSDGKLIWKKNINDGLLSAQYGLIDIDKNGDIIFLSSEKKGIQGSDTTYIHAQKFNKEGVLLKDAILLKNGIGANGFCHHNNRYYFVGSNVIESGVFIPIFIATDEDFNVHYVDRWTEFHNHRLTSIYPLSDTEFLLGGEKRGNGGAYIAKVHLTLSSIAELSQNSDNETTVQYIQKFLSVKSNDYSKFQCSLFSVQGESIYTINSSNGIGTIDCKQLQQGVYLYTVTNNGILLKSGKIIVD